MNALLIAVMLTADPLVPQVSRTEIPLVAAETHTGGTTRMAWGYTLGALGSSAAVASGVVIGMMNAPVTCPAGRTCINETGLAQVMMLAPLFLGLFMGSFAIPLITGGWWERNDS